jgi:hypothetical protein
MKSNFRRVVGKKDATGIVDSRVTSRKDSLPFFIEVLIRPNPTTAHLFYWRLVGTELINGEYRLPRGKNFHWMVVLYIKGKYFFVLILNLWKEAQREVRQHWFIYSYISAYIQALYMYCPVLLEYIRLVWPSTRDVGRCPQIEISHWTKN